MIRRHVRSNGESREKQPLRMSAKKGLELAIARHSVARQLLIRKPDLKNTRYAQCYVPTN